MGKIKQKKFKCHSSAPVSIVTDVSEKDPPAKIPNSEHKQVPVPVTNNIFRNIVIPPSILKQELPNSFAESKEEKNEKLNKSCPYNPLSMDIRKILSSQKKLNKKQRLPVAQVIEQYRKQKHQEKKKLKRKKKAVLGEWKSLINALSDPKKSQKKDSTQNNSSKRKRKEVESQMSDSMALFSSTLQNFQW